MADDDEEQDGAQTVHVDVTVDPPPPPPEPDPEPEPVVVVADAPGAADVAALIDAERRATEAEAEAERLRGQLEQADTARSTAWQEGYDAHVAETPEPEPVIIEPEPIENVEPDEDIEPVSRGVHWWYRPMREWKIFGGNK